MVIARNTQAHSLVRDADETVAACPPVTALAGSTAQVPRQATWSRTTSPPTRIPPAHWLCAIVRCRTCCPAAASPLRASWPRPTPRRDHHALAARRQLLCRGVHHASAQTSRPGFVALGSRCPCAADFYAVRACVWRPPPAPSAKKPAHGFVGYISTPIRGAARPWHKRWSGVNSPRCVEL